MSEEKNRCPIYLNPEDLKNLKRCPEQLNAEGRCPVHGRPWARGW